MALLASTTSVFGQQLRQWRLRAKLSQIDLAAQAGSTPRYISFIETGRSRPGRDLIFRLAEALNIPLSERNSLLVAAGLPPHYANHSLNDEALKPVKMVLERVLQSHEPYPAWVVGRGLRFLAANQAAEGIFPGMCMLAPDAIVDFWFGPSEFRQLVENWQDVVWAGLASLRRELVKYPTDELVAIVERIEGHLKAVPRPEANALPDFPVICPRFCFDGKVVRTISTVMRFDTAIDITAADLRVELMFPADIESANFFTQKITRNRSATGKIHTNSDLLH